MNSAAQTETFSNKAKTVRLNAPVSGYATLVGLNSVGWVIWANIVLPSELGGVVQKFNLSEVA